MGVTHVVVHAVVEHTGGLGLFGIQSIELFDLMVAPANAEKRNT